MTGDDDGKSRLSRLGLLWKGYIIGAGLALDVPSDEHDNELELGAGVGDEDGGEAAGADGDGVEDVARQALQHVNALEHRTDLDVQPGVVSWKGQDARLLRRLEDSEAAAIVVVATAVCAILDEDVDAR